MGVIKQPFVYPLIFCFNGFCEGLHYIESYLLKNIIVPYKIQYGIYNKKLIVI